MGFDEKKTSDVGRIINLRPVLTKVDPIPWSPHKQYLALFTKMGRGTKLARLEEPWIFLACPTMFIPYAWGILRSNVLSRYTIEASFR